LAGRDFLVEPGGLRALIENNLPDRNLEDAKIPIHVVATDILTGGTVVLSAGSPRKPSSQTRRFRSHFRPQGSRMQTVRSQATRRSRWRSPKELGVLSCLPTGYACALSKPPAGAVASALHALTLLIARQLLSELKELEGSNIEYFVLPPAAGPKREFVLKSGEGLDGMSAPSLKSA
jgi:NTE family protein